MRYLVLGIGNIMFADEGVGVHFVKLMQKNYTFHHPSASLEFMDGGTLAFQLSYILADYDRLIIVDCLEADDANIGDVFFFPYSAMPKKVSWSGSAHEIEMLQTLQFMELNGDLPQTQILAVIPKRIEPMSFKLSNELLKAIPLMQKTLLEYLSKEGFSYEKISDFSIQELAEISYKNP
ncbi:HyaD/HybD family hydrogenase maturation endopeptidase [Campylobacter sp. MIT 97-5078]|uniref:HyaD/HybD family hydrogenase maturation endopeptidase n=1 Tax=Campylobacter sp. MIT 97-5078 TaxID=1548153 RepID=UPI0005137144|nr:HyaD/HybD family hydrogenase maturation endopeptidase [Campylobacter sp. MIT 97-5078]KGI56551.1 hydrogenase [Campylobacter sp. MIT 97-5078]TQR26999.1 hydrogenase expression/formation protein [Campylobacter sp. MIT 97-5078]